MYKYAYFTGSTTNAVVDQQRSYRISLLEKASESPS